MSSIDIERVIRDLNAILEVSKAMSSEIQLDNLLQVIAQKTTEVMDADLSSLFVYDEKRNELWSKIAQKLGQLKEIRFPVEMGIAGDVAKTLRGANIADVYADPRFNADFDRQTGYRTRSILCLPMISSSTGKLIGVIQVLNKRGGRVFDERDESLLAALGAHAAVALERAQLTEAYVEKQRIEEALKLARDIQMSMLPKRFSPFPNAPAIDLYAAMEPAKEVGGDFYDFAFTDDHHLYFAIGDVCDKGIPAALLMAVTKTLLKVTASKGTLPDAILHEVNEELCRDNDSCNFATLFCGIVNTETGEVLYADAGHNPPLLAQRGKGVCFLEKSKGIAVGIKEDALFTMQRLRLQPGDFLFLYTDGVTEAMNEKEELFSQERLQREIMIGQEQSPQEMVTGIMQQLRTFCQGMSQTDDITMMVLRLQNGPRC